MWACGYVCTHVCMYAGRMYTFIHKKIFHASRLSALWFPSQISGLNCSNASRTCSPWLRLHSSSDIQHEPKASSSKYLVARSSLSPAPAVESRASDLPSAAQWRATWRGSYLEAKRERQTEAFHPESQLSASSHHDENGPQ